MRFIPLKVSLAVAGLLGKLGFRLLKKHRDIALSNLDEVFSNNHQENMKIAE
jgi:lauroyl/myristoyl acyltransferase